jgi:hypothetical protein
MMQLAAAEKHTQAERCKRGTSVTGLTFAIEFLLLSGHVNKRTEIRMRQSDILTPTPHRKQ